MKSYKEKAMEYFNIGYYCSQAVLLAYADKCNLDKSTATKIAQCFNSGMRKGGMCGACSGALMVIGLLNGQSDLLDIDKRKKSNELAEKFLAKFKEINGSCSCKQLLECDIFTSKGLEFAQKHSLFTKKCPLMVASAVDILENLEK